MQNTRLTRVLNGSIGQLGGWLLNPWRRISLVVVGLLFGNFLATAIATTSGQNAESDVVAGIFLVGLTELVSWYVYRWRQRTADVVSGGRAQPFLFAQLLNALKIGLTYGLFIEAFKLGS